MLFAWSLGLALAVAASTSHAQDCSALTQTTLTSVGCPTECGSASATCVLYAPGQTKCQSYKSSGPCLQQDGFTVPGSTDKCSVTYQCQGNLVEEGTTKWHLALLTSKAADTVFTAAVQTTRRLAYQTDAKVANTIQVDGGIDRTARGDFADFKPDNSFFATPSNIIGFYVAHIDMYNLLPRINFSAVAWVNVAFKNTNLTSVPLGLNQLGTQYLDLSMNYITTIDDPTPLSKVSTLNLAYNNLTKFTVELPAITTLNLSLNSFTTIPEVIFNMKTLTTLSMRKCNISNAQLTEAQFTFLEERTLDVDFTVTNCAPGYEERQLSGGTGRVCLPATNMGTESGSKVPLIAGIAGGVVVVLLLVYFLCRRSKRDGDYYDEVTKDPTVTQDLTFGTTTGETSAIWNDPDLLAVRIEYRGIEPIKLLSRGGFGEVWLGLYMNENVAIKRLLSDKKSMNDALAFASEVKIMARLDHPKIVRFIGVAWTNALTIQAVTEFMDCGDLRSLLDSNRASSLTWANLKCQIAIDIVDALVYLHTLNPKLIHRDLKSRNVLIDANTGAKLSDFGISRNRSVEETMTAGVGTARWIAPEVILGGHYTEFADIYSFGVVLSELDTCKSPFHDAVNTNGAKMQDVTILQLVSAGKLQPTFNNDCPEPIVRLARACLSFDAAQRPSAIHISYELRKILKDELSG